MKKTGHFGCFSNHVRDTEDRFYEGRSFLNAEHTPPLHPESPLTDDAVHAERQVVGHYAADVGAQAVADARQFVHVQAGRPQVGQRDRRALGHGLHVDHGGHVARQRRQLSPVRHEHVVLAGVQVRCERVPKRQRLAIGPVGAGGGGTRCPLEIFAFLSKPS